MPNESLGKTLLVALGVCLVCSVLVSTAAITLKDRQVENQERDMVLNLLRAGGLNEETRDPFGLFAQRFEPALVDLGNTSWVENPSPEALTAGSVQVASRNARHSLPLTSEEDLAGILRIPSRVTVYWVLDQAGEREKLILPFYGKGLWSTMYGFIALSTPDFSSIEGLTFFEHGETPGLGGEVDNPRWKNDWNTKKLLDTRGHYALQVAKGPADRTEPGAANRVDGLSGATLTSRGVDQMLRFWLSGPRGFGPLLEQLRAHKQEEHP